ncbi:hypothetical protein [Actinomadura sp. 7K534]|uniref:hypothetical protein n=1 Tax=Actinomadura sp. 7K534 TaxID=2530366 RepID=UPI001046BBFF|nr:hypothetical protein [Actinomadura sp. 7K534]TDB98004.1 hypothetical protein E1266_04660 [Actinomadura sp. 7K534]
MRGALARTEPLTASGTVRAAVVLGEVRRKSASTGCRTHRPALTARRNSMCGVRYVVIAGVAAAVAALLGLGQVAVAEIAGITTLDGEFVAGNERVAGVQVTLVAWYCAVAVPLAVASVTGRRDAAQGMPLTAVPAAAAGTLAALPLLAGLSGDFLRAEVISAAGAGILLGAAGALAVAAVPVIGRGLAAYVVLQWAAGLAFTAAAPRSVVYAGMVELLGVDSLAEMRPGMPDLPENLGYHLPGMLPVVVATVVLTGVVAGMAAHRTHAWAPATASALAGPLLAAAVYRLPSEQAQLWNGAASVAVLTVAVCCIPVAAVTAAAFRLGRS